MTNEEVAAAIQAGDIGHLLQLWEQVRRFAVKQAGRWCRALGDRAGVTQEDLTQCAFLALLDALSGYDPDGGSFIGWYAMSLKTAFTEACGVRTQRDRQDPVRSALSMDAPLTDTEGDPFTLADVTEDPAAEAAIQSVEELDRMQRLHDALESAISTLPEDQQTAIREKYYRGGAADTRTVNAALRALRHPRISWKLREYL